MMASVPTRIPPDSSHKLIHNYHIKRRFPTNQYGILTSQPRQFRSEVQFLFESTFQHDVIHFYVIDKNSQWFIKGLFIGKTQTYRISTVTERRKEEYHVPGRIVGSLSK